MAGAWVDAGAGGRRRLVSILFLGLVLAMPLAMAERVDEATVTSRAGAHISGAISWSSGDGTLLVTLGDMAQSEVVITADSVGLQVFNRSASGPAVPYLSVGPQSNNRETFLAFSATIDLQALPGASHVLVHTAGNGEARMSLDMGETVMEDVGFTSTPFHYTYVLKWGPLLYEHLDASPGLSFDLADEPSAAPWEVLVEGDVVMFVIGARMHVVGDSFDRTFDLVDVRHVEHAPGSETPLMYEDAVSYAMLDMKGARIAIRETQTAAVHLHLTEPSASVQGSLAIPAASGSVRTSAGVFPVDDELLYVEGAFQYAVSSPSASLNPAMVFGGDAPRHVIEGGFSLVHIGGATVHQPSLPYREAAALVLLAAILALLPQVRGAFGSMLGFFYTRLSRRHILDSGPRREVLAAIASEPGIHMRALQARTGFGWGKLEYHVQTLRKAGYVEVERVGRLSRLRCSGEAPQEGRDEPLAGTAAEVRASLLGGEALTHADIAERIGISRQLASYHVRRLEREGLIERVDGRPRRYRIPDGGPGA